MTTIAELVIGDDPAAWSEAGFAVGEDGTTLAGTVRLRFDAALSPGEIRWVLAGTPDESVTDVDGLATTHTDPAPTAATADPLGVTCIDHLVVMTPDLDRTVAAVEGHLGLPCRRVREAGGGVVQAFFRMGEVVLEVVTSPQVPDGSARFWGITFTVRDLDAAAARLGPERAGEPKPAVQPGRRIVTVRKAAGLAIPVALMDADPRR